MQPPPAQNTTTQEITEPGNLGPGWAMFHLINFRFLRSDLRKPQKIRVGYRNFFRVLHTLHQSYFYLPTCWIDLSWIILDFFLVLKLQTSELSEKCRLKYTHQRNLKFQIMHSYVLNFSGTIMEKIRTVFQVKLKVS